MVFLFKVSPSTNCFWVKYYITAHSLSEDVISEKKKKKKNTMKNDITKAACHVSVNLEIYFVSLTLFVSVGLVCKLLKPKHLRGMD